MKPEELIKYELPSWTEFISIDWIQNILARYYTNKVNKKFARYENRRRRDEFIRRVLDKKNLKR